MIDEKTLKIAGLYEERHVLERKLLALEAQIKESVTADTWEAIQRWRRACVVIGVVDDQLAEMEDE